MGNTSSPSSNTLDFLWLAKGDEVADTEWTSLQQEIKRLTGVQLVMELATASIRNKAHLIF